MNFNLLSHISGLNTNNLNSTQSGSLLMPSMETLIKKQQTAQNSNEKSGGRKSSSSSSLPSFSSASTDPKSIETAISQLNQMNQFLPPLPLQPQQFAGAPMPNAALSALAASYYYGANGANKNLNDAANFFLFQQQQQFQLQQQHQQQQQQKFDEQLKRHKDSHKNNNYNPYSYNGQSLSSPTRSDKNEHKDHSRSRFVSFFLNQSFKKLFLIC